MTEMVTAASPAAGGGPWEAHPGFEAYELVIPPGVPHQFAAVSDPFLYLVAKVRD